jgi:hypothetical protein
MNDPLLKIEKELIPLYKLNLSFSEMAQKSGHSEELVRLIIENLKRLKYL